MVRRADLEQDARDATSEQRENGRESDETRESAAVSAQGGEDPVWRLDATIAPTGRVRVYAVSPGDVVLNAEASIHDVEDLVSVAVRGLIEDYAAVLEETEAYRGLDESDARASGE